MFDALGVSDLDLSCADWEARMLEGAVPSSQTLADRLIAKGYIGMLVWRFAPGVGSDDINLALWNWGSDGSGRVILTDDEGRRWRAPAS